MKTVSIIGCGGLGGIIADGIVDSYLAEHYRLVSVCDVNAAAAEAVAQRCGCGFCTEIDRLLAQKTDIVVEAAGVGVLRACAVKVLVGGSDLIPLSIGAFADAALLDEVRATARAQGRKVYLPSGAIGGLDLVRSAMWAGGLSAGIQNIKPPAGLNGAPFLNGKVLSETETEQLFDGSAAEAIAAFPKNVNVAVALALASCGMEQTRVQVVSDPGQTLNLHCIDLQGDFGRARLEIGSVPSATASSSSLAAYSVLAKLESLCAEVSF